MNATNKLRRLTRALLVALWLLYGMILGCWVWFRGYRTPKPKHSAGLAHHWCRGFLRICQVKVEQRGSLPPGPHLLISNHISWLDIPVLSALKPTLFLSKSEVRQWPIVGWLGQQAGTLFIKRGRGQAKETQIKLEKHLSAGCSAVIFPEGTTTDGRTLRPFHHPLLASAVTSGTPLLPISLSYRQQGQLDEQIPFIGEDTFFPHLLNLLGRRQIEVQLTIHTPLPSLNTNARTLASQSKQVIQTALPIDQLPKAREESSPNRKSDLPKQCAHQ